MLHAKTPFLIPHGCLDILYLFSAFQEMQRKSVYVPHKNEIFEFHVFVYIMSICTRFKKNLIMFRTKALFFTIILKTIVEKHAFPMKSVNSKKTP